MYVHMAVHMDYAPPPQTYVKCPLGSVSTVMCKTKAIKITYNSHFNTEVCSRN